MYKNYGDRDFFEMGILVDTEHSDTVFPMLRCMPYSDEEDLFQFGELEVDINDSWINEKAVSDFCGSTKAEDPVGFAIGCTDYYSWDNFGAISYAYDWTRMSRDAIKDILKYRTIALDNLNISW